MGADLEDILSRGSKSFHLASRLLPPRVRKPTLVLYAFLRFADDAVDDARDGTTAVHAVERLRERIDRAFAARDLHDPLLRAFADVLRTFDIPRSELDLFCDGMEWDARGHSYTTFEDLLAYANRVAGTVGVMMTHVMKCSAPLVLERARMLGMAMQLTNVARDVGEDARRGRVYLPSTWLADAGVDPRTLRTSPPRAVVRRLLEAADERYAFADRGIAYLPPDCRVAIRTARLVYAEIGNVIRARGYDSVTERATVPLTRKLTLLSYAALARFARRRPLVEMAS